MGVGTWTRNQRGLFGVLGLEAVVVPDNDSAWFWSEVESDLVWFWGSGRWCKA